ncbi:MAG: hypothetical protein KDD70_12195 [Bdellovibrionales bacterium]|nr:hypothetical protein [Bdellovibrionales bacterium]
MSNTEHPLIDGIPFVVDTKVGLRGELTEEELATIAMTLSLIETTPETTSLFGSAARIESVTEGL